MSRWVGDRSLARDAVLALWANPAPSLAFGALAGYGEGHGIRLSAMVGVHRFVLRFLAVAVAALAGLLVDVSTAYAQANSCARLQATLQTLERNGDFRQSSDNRGDAKRLQRDLQRAESSYVRQGCNDDAKAGRKLNGECRALAKTILQGRKDVENVKRSVDTGEAVAQQREAILQEMARFDCDGRSSVKVERSNRGNIFEQLFGVLNDNLNGEGDGEIRGDEFNPYGDYHTVRTLCVRKTDGFYWPISYSTLVDYVPNDAEQCRAQCPSLDVDLYYYDNPGQEPAQMVNQFGEPYSSLPAAFKFRTEFDTISKCTSTEDMGVITLAQLPDGATRAVITFRNETFPLPVRDPRRIATNIIQAPTLVAEVEYVDVPLPRRRPAAPGEAPKPVAVAMPVAPDQPQKLVDIGGKRVRIVGPVTPYAQLGEAGT